MLKCKNGDCRNTFRWPMQLYGITQICKKPAPGIKKSIPGKMYSCLKCNKIFKHQSNVVRHVTVTKCAKDIKEKGIFQCQKCKKTVQFICRLKSHV